VVLWWSKNRAVTSSLEDYGGRVPWPLTRPSRPSWPGSRAIAAAAPAQLELVEPSATVTPARAAPERLRRPGRACLETNLWLAVAAAYGAQWPKAVAKITNDLDVLLAFYDFPAEHWIHLRTTNPIESTFATVRLRQRVTKGPGSRAAGIAMALKLIESAQHRWRAVNSAHLVALVRAGAKFENGVLVERPDESTSGDTHAA
jgi:Transposase, Mutator family